MIRSSHLPKLIFLQGPPQCGKDTIADLLVNMGGYTQHKFAQPIVDAMKAQFPSFFDFPIKNARSIEDFKRHDFGPYLHADKNVKVTGRDIMIAWSEKFMKPLFGDTIFGKLADRRVFDDSLDWTDSSYRVVMSDSGFEPESIPPLATIGGKHAAIIQVYRPGHNFTGDSRSYWSNPEVATYSYMNDKEGLDAFQKDFIKFFNSNVFSYSDQRQLRSAHHG